MKSHTLVAAFGIGLLLVATGPGAAHAQCGKCADSICGSQECHNFVNSGAFFECGDGGCHSTFATARCATNHDGCGFAANTTNALDAAIKARDVVGTPKSFSRLARVFDSMGLGQSRSSSAMRRRSIRD